MTTTPEAIAELKRLLDEATPGPWYLDYDKGNNRGFMTDKAVLGSVRIAYVDHKQYKANGEIVCAAVNALPSLLADLVAAQKRERLLRVALDAIMDDNGRHYHIDQPLAAQARAALAATEAA